MSIMFLYSLEENIFNISSSDLDLILTIALLNMPMSLCSNMQTSAIVSGTAYKMPQNCLCRLQHCSTKLCTEHPEKKHASTSGIGYQSHVHVFNHIQNLEIVSYSLYHEQQVFLHFLQVLKLAKLIDSRASVYNCTTFLSPDQP